GGAIGKTGGILNHRDFALGGAGSLGYQSGIGKSGGRQNRSDERRWSRGRVEFDARGESAASQTEINAERVGALVGHRDVGDSAVGEIGDYDSCGSGSGWQRRARRGRESA